MIASVTHKRLSERGFAMLEASLALSVLTTLFLGVVFFTHWYRTTNTLSEALDRQVYETSIKPFSVSNFTTGELTITTNTGVLDTYVQQAALRLEQELVGIQAETGPEDYYLEVAWAEAVVDEETGAFQSFVQSPFSSIEALGTLSLPTEVDQRTSLSDALTLRAQLTDSTGALLGASPTAYFGATDRSLKYHPRVIFVAARAILNMDQGISGQFYSQFLEPYVSRVKVIVLRGEFEL